MNMIKESRLDRVMNSLEGMEQAQVPDHVYSNIRRTLAEQQESVNSSGYQWLAVAAVIALVICSNLFVISKHVNAELPSEVQSDYSLTINLDLYQ